MSPDYSASYCRIVGCIDVKKQPSWLRIVEKILEVKQANNTISSSLKYFCSKYHWPSMQLVKELRQEKISDGIEIRKLLPFLEELF